MKTVIRLLILVSLASTIVYGCKTETLIGDFALLNNPVREGERLMIINKSQNAEKYNWSNSAGSWTSSAENPDLYFETAGEYQLKLVVNRGRKHSEKNIDIVVTPDTIWRLTSNSSKTWYVSSLVYAGTEMLAQDCQKDDEFTLVKQTPIDTFSFTEGIKTCPSGTYIFNIPASGAWRFNLSKKTLEFALTAFGSPYNFQFSPSVLSKDSFVGYDAVNDVVMKLKSSK